MSELIYADEVAFVSHFDEGVSVFYIDGTQEFFRSNTVFYRLLTQA